ncbi:MAG: DUF1802 family protein [Synechococcales cyanobacterium M58_A2018_015]|nr:DUF1802 family protein [Synechococcales cyanobacterium M58_A2018_015]
MTSTSVSTLTAALKEWAVAVQALAEGETIVLLRKGGIREQGGQFTVEARRVWLYPTYEHQKRQWLKPSYAAQVTEVASGWHPEQVTIQAWAEITHILPVFRAETVEALLPFHIWTADFAAERLRWKPRSPLWVLLLRVHRLPEARMIPYQTEYGGCKSWIELPPTLSLAGSEPVLADAAYHERVAAIQRIIEEEEPHDEH